MARLPFVSWAVEYARAQEALANKSWEEYFISAVENHHTMRTSYTQLGNVTDFIDWLRMKAEQEAYAIEMGLPSGQGAIPFVIGGY